MSNINIRSLTTMAAIALSMAATAQRLTIADVEAVPGETVEYVLSINVDGGDHKGFQYEMQFPATGFELVGTTYDSETWKGATFQVSDVLKNGWARGSAHSMTDTSIPDGDLDIGTVKFSVDKTLPLGDYNVTISGFDFLDGYNYVHANGGSDVVFTIHVVERHNITLDETSTTAPAASYGAANVTVKRTINAGEWSTICLPFAMTAEQVKDAFGDDVQIANFTGYETEKNEDGDIVGIIVNFDMLANAAIEKNHPYIIKVSNKVESFAVENVVVDPEEEPTVAAVKRTKKQWSEMIGTYAANTVLEVNFLFLSDNQFWYSAGKTKMKAFRAYFDFYDVLTEVENASSSASRIRMAFDDGETTGISSAAQSSNGTQLYDLQGRAVDSPTKGLYIQNGKKTVIK